MNEKKKTKENRLEFFTFKQKEFSNGKRKRKSLSNMIFCLSVSCLFVFLSTFLRRKRHSIWFFQRYCCCCTFLVKNDYLKLNWLKIGCEMINFSWMFRCYHQYYVIFCIIHLNYSFLDVNLKCVFGKEW